MSERYVEKICRDLCTTVGVSGYENMSTTQAAVNALKEFTSDIQVDHMGSVVGYLNRERTDLPLLLLDAHIDEIGMIVTYIEDDGFVRVSNCGGIDRRLLSAQEVTIFGKKEVFGVFGSKPPHLATAEERNKIPELSEMYIDVGMSKEEAEKWITPGDRVITNSAFRPMLNDRIAVKSLDDRCGIACILEALRLLKEENAELPCRLAVLFSAQEETNFGGAETAAYRINPDMAIAIDVSFALTSDAPRDRCGIMGKGALIGISPVLNKSMSDDLIRIAKEKEIPWQYEVMGAHTGTNADALNVMRGGVVTGVVSIPLRYMHTPIEEIQLSDLEAVGKLLAEYAKQAKL